MISVTADIGIIGVAPTGLGEAYVNQHLSLIKLDPESVDPEWVGMYLANGCGQRQFNQFTDVGAKAGMNLTAVQSLLVGRPPKPEQVEVVRRVSAVQDRIERETEERKKLQKLKAGLMHDLLTGKKRVNQPALSTA